MRAERDSISGDFGHRPGVWGGVSSVADVCGADAVAVGGVLVGDEEIQEKWGGTEKGCLGYWYGIDLVLGTILCLLADWAQAPTVAYRPFIGQACIRGSVVDVKSSLDSTWVASRQWIVNGHGETSNIHANHQATNGDMPMYMYYAQGYSPFHWG